MLDKNEMVMLLREKKYKQINNNFYNSINEMVKNKLLLNNIEVDINNNLSTNNYILLENFPMFKGLTMLITEITQTETVDDIDILERYMDNYKFIREKLT